MKEVLKAEDIRHNLEILIKGFEKRDYAEFESKEEKEETILSYKTWLNAQVCFTRIIEAISDEQEDNYKKEIEKITREKVNKAYFQAVQEGGGIKSKK